MPLSPQQIERLHPQLWPGEGHVAYALLDGAGIPNLLDHLYGDDGPAFECLYMGELAPDIAEVAPYLARLDPGSAFADWVLSGWGDHWGICAVVPASLDLPALRRHFRKLNIVYGPDAQPLMFRYYDPRVFGDFLPSCGPKQLGEVFGPVSHFVLEDTSPEAALVLTLGNGQLVAEHLPLQ